MKESDFMPQAMSQKINKLYQGSASQERMHRRVKVLIGFLCASSVLLAFSFNLVERFELTTFDWRSRFSADRNTSEKIILIDIAEDSIESIGRWPWSRDWHATMISLMTEFGAEAILYDVLFSEPSTSNQDAVLREAIRKSGKVYLPVVFHFNEKESLKGSTSPMEMFAKYAKGIGHVNVPPDLDGTLRRTPLYLFHENVFIPQLSYLVVKDYLNLKEDRQWQKGRITLTSDKGQETTLTLDEKNRFIINWAGRWVETFKHYSFVDIIKAYADYRQSGFVSEILRNLKGKICLVGITAHGLYDIKPIPLESTFPAVGVHANIINNIIQEKHIKPTSKLLECCLIILLGLIVSTVASSSTHIVRGIIWAASIALLYCLASFLVFKWFGYLVSLVYPLLSIFLSFIGVTFYNEISSLIEKKELVNLATVDELTGLYNVRHFRDVLSREFSKSGHRRRRNLSVIISDIDHFKKFNDTYGHQTGDFILSQTAGLFKRESRDHDIVCRYGGEEFAIILPDTASEDAFVIAERMRKSVEENRFQQNGTDHKVTVSLGIAELTDEFDMEALIKKADQALYRAKDSGRNQTIKS